jgi:hypothetical protein
MGKIEYNILMHGEEVNVKLSHEQEITIVCPNCCEDVKINYKPDEYGKFRWRCPLCNLLMLMTTPPKGLNSFVFKDYREAELAEPDTQLELIPVEKPWKR